MGESKKIFFTFIINIVDSGSMKNLLDSIYAYKPSSLVQCVVVDGNGILTENADIMPAEYADKVSVIKSSSADIADVYDAAKSLIKGKYITFIDNTTEYKKGALKAVKMRIDLNNSKAVCLKPVYLDPNMKKTQYPIAPEESGYYDVLHNPQTAQLFFGAYFWKKSVVESLGFNSSSVTEKEKDFILRYFLEYGKIHYIETKSLTYRFASENEFATNLIQYKIEWYQEDVENYLLKLAENAGDATESKRVLILCYVYYLLYARFHCNLNDRNKKVLNDDEIDRFYEAAQNVLSYIPDEIIMCKVSLGNYKVPRSVRFFLLKLKYEYLNQNYKIIDNGRRFYIYSQCDNPIRYNYFFNSNSGQIFVQQKGTKYEDDLPIRKLYKRDANYVDTAGADHAKELITLGLISEEKIFVSAINYMNGKIIIDAKSSLVDFIDYEDISIIVTVNEKEYPLKPVKCYPYMKSFGRVFLNRYQFSVSIPALSDQKLKVEFFYDRNGKRYPQNLVFSGAASKLSNVVEKSYWNFDKNKIMFLSKPNMLVIRKVNKAQLVYREALFLKNMQKYMKENGLWDKEKELYKLRVDYQLKKHLFANRHIWVTFDKLYKAGDNGEYMYHYLKKHKLGVKPYYIVNEDAPDYKRLIDADENILVTNSYKCKLMCLLSEVVLATHTTIWTYCGFQKSEYEYFRDLFNAKLVCIQHGLTVQQIAQYQNRLFDNTQYYCCASKYEIDNILQPIYGYNKKQIALTGLARYDGLKNNDQKSILITPTWRRDIVNNGIACVKKTHNNHFKDSTYFKVYNSLINDKKLIAQAKKTGYEVVFLLHPAMSAQSVDYDRNDYVKIVEATSDVSYEKILTESSLMVTDYSGVQFDFAYMRKPIVYYHPSALPPFYDNGIFQYDTMGFGEICKEHDEIVNTLCEYMENNCRCKEKYVERANDFFAFDDFNSCERIYNAVKKFVKDSIK